MKRSTQTRMQILFAFLLFTIGTYAQNPIVTENALTGNPATEWDISGSGDQNIQGFATQMSVNKGQTINFKIKSTTTYTIDIYRLGWYGGNGARKVSTSNPVVFDAALPQTQPADLYDAVTGKVSCSNWPFPHTGTFRQLPCLVFISPSSPGPAAVPAILPLW
jgi:hypothetical protein